MISTWFCVTCDICGAPAGGMNDLRETNWGARQHAKDLGFVRVPDHPATVPVDADLCPSCAAKEGVQ